MEKLNIIPNLEVRGFKPEPYDVVPYTGEITIGAMPNGTERGKPTVMIGITLDDGSVLVMETTLSLYLTAGDAFVARHGDPRPKPSV